MGELSYDIARLVDAGKIDEALKAANGLTPERVRTLLFSGAGFMENSGPYGEFLSRWYESLNSPYLRAEAADWFAQAYLTEIADLKNAEFLGAKMATESKREVIKHLADTIDSKDIEDWTTSPEKPISKDQHNHWQKIAQKLKVLLGP
ncbi:hypothetical protein AOZ07_16205 [Glutamicibacter halophytocola]|nr:hypothetical protein AOZ07_16205 [Glutamicibacter halophytocola]